MALDGKPVLLFARDAVFLGDQLAGHTHVKIFVGVPQAVVNHRVHNFLIAEPVAGARSRQEIRTIGHRLHSTGNDHLGFAELHGLGGQ